MSTIRFEIRKDKEDRFGRTPIRMIYQISGDRKYYSPGLKLRPENWDEFYQKAFYLNKPNQDEGEEDDVFNERREAFKRSKLTSDEVKEINDELEQLRIDINRIEKRFDTKNYTVSDVLAELTKQKEAVGGKQVKEPPKDEVFRFIDKYKADNKNKVVAGTLKVYDSLAYHLNGYQKAKKTKLAFEKMDKDFLTDFYNYLVELEDEDGNFVLNNITAAKRLSNLKTILKKASEDKAFNVPPNFTNYKMNHDNIDDVISLNRKEFDKVFNHSIENETYAQVRDAFCLSVLTGLRFSDIEELKRVNIKSDHISLSTKKTGTKVKIPLVKQSLEILSRYAHSDKPMPTISGQKSNEYLHKIFEELGFNEEIEVKRKHGSKEISTVYKKHDLLTFHAGRKSFAGICSAAGMKEEHIKGIGGWKNKKNDVFDRYREFDLEILKEEMYKVWGYPNEGKLKKLKAV